MMDIASRQKSVAPAPSGEMPGSSPRYQTKADVAPLLMEFLHDLRLDDIVTELVQNDLDQGARITQIHFDRDRLIAEGNGAGVDDEGWQRLTYVQGAGGDVPAKRNGIGIKNHGLRTCFLLGDDIVVRSAGQKIQLTLRRDGRGTRFFPGAWEHPAPDGDAPPVGCRIEVPIRTQMLHAPGGEGVDLPVPTEADLTRLFIETCRLAPQRYIGCLRPGLTNRYVLELVHWREGTYRFTYTVAPLRGPAGRILYRRRCRAEFPNRKARIYLEDAYLFASKTVLPAGRSIPAFFRRGSHVMLEVSWSVNSLGRPSDANGRFRYPIAYVGQNENAATSTGVNFSGPFLSDTARHGIAEALHTLNQELVAECEEAIVRILADHLVPRYGPDALQILQDPDLPRSQRFARIAFKCASAGALPAASPTGRKAKHRRFGKVPQPRDEDWAFIIPASRWDHRKVSARLAELAPPAYVQIDPDCPEGVIETLVDAVYSDGQDLEYTTFDERDVIQRLQPEDIEGFFPWESENQWKSELSRANRVRKYLDILHLVMRTGKATPAEIESLRKSGRLPDLQGQIAAWDDLHRASGKVEAGPGVGAPRQVHPTLENHAILRRGKLALRTFRLDEFLSGLDFTEIDPPGRDHFFRWFIRNHRKLTGAAVKSVADYPVWPTEAGEYVRFEELCLPQKTVKRIFEGYLHVPEAAILDMKRVRTDGRGLLRLRRTPSTTEIRPWYHAQLVSFPSDTRMGAAEIQDLKRFEAALSTLRRDRKLRAEMPFLNASHPGLSEDGVLRPVGLLHLHTEAVDRCELRPIDLARTSQEDLYGDLGSQLRPTQAAIYRALEEDAAADAAFFPRLLAFVEAGDSDDELEERIQTLRFFPVDGRRVAPVDVSLKSSQDYWGDWKIPYDASGLSADRQESLRRVGVMGRTPTTRTSRLFFEWLSGKDEEVVKRHLDQVIRHFLHEHGPLRWWREYPRLRCLPVYGQGKSVRLINHKEAFEGNPGPLLPDLPKLEDTILARDRRRRIVIVETDSIRRSILSVLRGLGLRTIRQVVLPPIRVVAEEAGEMATGGMAIVEHLLSGRVRRELQKRLQELEIPDAALKTKWRNEISRITSVQLAKQVLADLACGSKTYRLPVPAGIDTDTGVLWIEAEQDVQRAVFDAVAERVFEPGAPKYYSLALQQAVTMDYSSRFKSDREASSLEQDEPESPHDPEETLQGTGPSVDTKKAHPVPTEDTRYNQPSPEPFKPEEYKGRATSGSGTTTSKPGPVPADKPRSRSRLLDPIEKAAITKLKVKHYASHCQACLAEHDPATLAPQGSYGFRSRNRRMLVHAHHVAPVHAEGERVITNILLLCKYHHDLLGDQLERPVIGELLEKTVTKHTVTYPGVAGGAPKTITGDLVTLALDREPWTMRLFFAEEHARIWRDAARK